jgi:hypothetical protein
MSIFNLFKTKTKSNNELVAEIHESFNTEVDRILYETGLKKDIPAVDEKLSDKVSRLKKMGFSSAKGISELKAKAMTVQNIERDNRRKDELREAALYFSQKYPLNKFITKESVMKICEKYGLIYGGVEYYEGDVPDKNLREIESFKLHKEDSVWQKSSRDRSMMMDWGMSHKKMKKEVARGHSFTTDDSERIYSDNHVYISVSLIIAAPPSDFNMENMNIRHFEIVKQEIPDPVVMQPVMFEEKEYYLILSAWGEEASDDSVVNQKFN